jgi:lipid II:glycine glycyltransferase (peptidoglycan interpeptide bridge formation enzyme)
MLQLDNNSYKFMLLDIDDDRWASYVHSHPSSNAFHHPAWAKLISDCYGYRAFVCAIIDENHRILAGSPFIDINSWLTGHRWVSLPYTDFCPPLSTNESALSQLIEGFHSTYQKHIIPSIEIRWTVPPENRINFTSEFVLHHLLLSDNIKSIYRKIRSNHRLNLKKADRNGVQIVNVDNKREYDFFYKLHTQTRKRLGVPVQPKKFFDLIWDKLIAFDLGFVLIAYHHKQPISGALFLNYNNTVIFKYGASDEAYWKLHSNKLLMWRAIQISCEKGYKIFNFGNSPINNQGLRQYKLGWGSIESDLIYSHIGRIPSTSQHRFIDKIMSKVIRNSPAVVCRSVGELLYKHFG